MFKILLVDRRPRLELTFKINFKTYLNAETESVNEDNWIMSMLPELEAFDMLIVNPAQFKPDIIQQILDELEVQELGTTIIWLGENEFEREGDLTLGLVPPVKDLLQKSATVLHITPEQMASLEVPDYYPFPSEILNHLIYLPCDIYHKIDNEMELVIPKGGFLRASEVSEVNKGHNEFYVKSNERLNLTNSFTEQFIHLRQAFKSKKVDVNERLRMMDNAMDYFSAEFSREGMTDEVIDMARDCIDSLLSLCNEFEMAEDLQNKLLGENFSVQLLYAQIIIFISIHSSKLLGWIFEEPEKSVALAAFFHDLGLKSDKESQIRSDEEVPEVVFKDINSLKFYMEKAQDVLASDEKLNDNERRTIKGVTQVITEFTQMVKGNSENPNDFRELIPSMTEKISTLLG